MAPDTRTPPHPRSEPLAPGRAGPAAGREVDPSSPDEPGGSPPPSAVHPAHLESQLERYRAVRAATQRLCEPLAVEDQVVQTMENVSPTKWHLAHVSWFFETFVLQPYLPGYEPFDEEYAYLFNSYYVQAGERHCRDRRGYISRPTVREVLAYRAHVDEGMERLLPAGAGGDAAAGPRASGPALVIEIGLHHEQQHQELILTDVKHVLGVNPLRPAYREDVAGAAGESAPPLRWVGFEGGLREVGYEGPGFRYDNEEPRHRVWLEDFELASRPVTCGEYLEFMRDGGYERPALWLSDGWATVREREWSEPFYWEERDGTWCLHTLGGRRPVDPDEPVCHLSYFEADAFARWAGCRLPTEEEWEVAARTVPIRGNFVEADRLHPAPAGSGIAVSNVDGGAGPAGGSVARDAVREGEGPLLQMFGDVWEWTRSQYEPYPGYRAPEGAIGEYNGKFMCDQFVLRGGSCATPVSHVRPTYRNFFHADEAWQFTGLRLARDA